MKKFDLDELRCAFLKTLQKEYSAGLGIIKRIIGRIQRDGGFIPGQDLEQSIERQKEINSQLGEVLVHMGVLGPHDLAAVLSMQKELSAVEHTAKPEQAKQDYLGELLVRAKLITAQQLEHALLEQEKTGEKLGDLLVRLKVISEQEKDVALEYQRHQRGEVPGRERLRLGQILADTGQITREQLAEALRRQKKSRTRLGDVLVQAGYVYPDQIKHGLSLQQKLVTAAIIAAVTASNMIDCEEARAAATALESKIGVHAVVLERTNMELMSQAKELLVTDADINRGYVDVPLGSRVNVKTNSRGGCLLAFEMIQDPGVLNTIFVNISGREIQLSSGAGWVQLPYIQGGTTQDVSYRFVLSKNAQPGTYVWPLTISVLPLGAK